MRAAVLLPAASGPLVLVTPTASEVEVVVLSTRNFQKTTRIVH